MGPIVAKQVKAVLTPQISSQKMTKQLQNLFNKHQKQLEAIKKISTNFSILDENRGFFPEGINKDITNMFQLISQYIEHVRQCIDHLAKKHPQNFVGQLIPTQDQIRKIIVTFRRNSNTEKLSYLLDKQFDKKHVPSFKVSCNQFAPIQQSMFSGLKNNLDDIPIKNAANKAQQLYNIGIHLNETINNIQKRNKLVESKLWINNYIQSLPMALIQLTQTFKQIIIKFIVQVILAGELFTRFREVFQFISLFSCNKQQSTYFREALPKIPSPFQLITQYNIKVFYYFVKRFQDTLVKMNSENAWDWIIQINYDVNDFVKAVKNIRMKGKIQQHFIPFEKDVQKAGEQLKIMRKQAYYMSEVIKILDDNKKSDDTSGPFFIQNYRQLFKKQNLQAFDKIVVVKCVAALRQKFYADDKSGLTFLGYKLSQYRSNSVKNSQLAHINTDEEDVTQYEQNWVRHFKERICKQIAIKHPMQNDIQKIIYYRSTLNFQKDGSFGQRLKVTKSVFFRGYLNLYKVECNLYSPQQFKVSFHSEENKSNFKTFQRAELRPGKKLLNGQYLKSINGEYYAVLHQDGNFVVYKGEKWSSQTAVWSSKTNRQKSQYTLIMQQNGYLCIFDKKGSCIWKIVTKRVSCTLSLLDNGRLAIINQNYEEEWSSSGKP